MGQFSIALLRGFLFPQHGEDDPQWSEAELPFAGKGACLLSIGTLVLKCAMVGCGGQVCWSEGGTPLSREGW